MDPALEPAANFRDRVEHDSGGSALSGATPELVERWRERLQAINGFKMGIAWQGNPHYPADAARSIPLRHFAALAELPGVRLISLQKEFGREQLTEAGFSPIDFSDELDKDAGPFMDTAAILQQVELLVTSDTAIAHLAVRWAYRHGLRCRTFPIGAGCSTTTTARGILRCGSSGKKHQVTGKRFLPGSHAPSWRSSIRQEVGHERS